MALAQVLQLYVHQSDVNSAFLFADLDEEIWMTHSPDMGISTMFCLKLLKKLYGLKQAPCN